MCEGEELWSRADGTVGSAAVVLAGVGSPPLAALLLLEELTDVFGSHHLPVREARRVR